LRARQQCIKDDLVGVRRSQQANKNLEPFGLPDERAAFDAAVRAPIGTAPLHELARASDTVAIVIADITRPSPSERLVPWILAELAHVPRENFVIINGTWTISSTGGGRTAT
jgi:nickel-dependent lactate racemase